MLLGASSFKSRRKADSHGKILGFLSIACERTEMYCSCLHGWISSTCHGKIMDKPWDPVQMILLLDQFQEPSLPLMLPLVLVFPSAGFFRLLAVHPLLIYCTCFILLFLYMMTQSRTKLLLHHHANFDAQQNTP